MDLKIAKKSSHHAERAHRHSLPVARSEQNNQKLGKFASVITIVSDDKMNLRQSNFPVFQSSSILVIITAKYSGGVPF